MLLGAMVEPEIEMSLVRRLIVGEADVTVNTEQALVDAGVKADSITPNMRSIYRPPNSTTPAMAHATSSIRFMIKTSYS